MKNLEAEVEELMDKYDEDSHDLKADGESWFKRGDANDIVLDFIRTREKRLTKEMIGGLEKEFGGNYSYGWNQKRKEIINIARKYEIDI